MSEELNFPLKKFYREIHKRYDLVNRVFTFGQDRVWRKKAAVECLFGKAGRILDICTGTGDLAIEIDRQAEHPAMVTGYDFSSEMLSLAIEKAKQGGGERIQFIVGNVSSFPFESGEFDAAGIAFGIRNLVYKNSDADTHLKEIHRVLKPGGRLVILESSNPSFPVWRFINGTYLRHILPYLGGWISGNREAYKYLSESSSNYYTIDEMAEILAGSGFDPGIKKSLFLGSVMLLVVIKHNGSSSE